MRPVRRSGVCAVVAVVAALVAACGDNKSPTSPTPSPGGGGGNPPPTTPTNRNPVIESMTINPELAVSGLTRVDFASTATDPDGDQLTYKWDIGGSTTEARAFNATLSGAGGTVAVKLTVSDGKGGTATQTKNIGLGNMTGSWRGTAQVLGTVSSST